jgi:dTDP-4-dehydrorhamnose reductase
MRILVTGADGQLGREIVQRLDGKAGYELTAMDIDKLDITSSYKVFDTIEALRPHVVINCAAYTKVDACEENVDLAYRINAIGPQNLAAATFDIGAKLVHISTDYVFDGTSKVPLKEDAKTNPINVYGASKKLGEEMVRSLNPRHFIFRTAWLYGDGKNFVRTMLSLGQKGDIIRVVNDQIGSPTSTVDLSNCIIEMMHTNSYGTYHATCQGSCSWYDFAKEIFRLKGMNVEVVPITTEELGSIANRPGYSVLDNFMLRLIDKDIFRNWQDALYEYIREDK